MQFTWKFVTSLASSSVIVAIFVAIGDSLKNTFCIFEFSGSGKMFYAIKTCQQDYVIYDLVICVTDHMHYFFPIVYEGRFYKSRGFVV